MIVTTKPSKTARSALSARYRSALRKHLNQKNATTAPQARLLGKSALAGGFATLDLAIIHEQAVVTLSGSFDFVAVGNHAIKRAGEFFTQALVPLEADQRSVRESNLHLKQRNETLRVHTAALAKANRNLEREVTHRKAGEDELRKSKEEYRTLFLESQVMQKKLRQLTRQIISAQEDERKEISRELHDEVVQTLVGINVELSALSKGTSAGLQTLRVKINRTQRLVENSVNAVHRFARELRPAMLDDLGLIPALHTYSKSLAARKKLKIQLLAFRGVEDLESASRTVLFRVAQEALTNVVRHANARLVKINITPRAGSICMEISDDGKSFAVEKTIQAKNNHRLGLIGMRERMEMVGGTLSIESAPGCGTTVRAEIPFSR